MSAGVEHGPAKTQRQAILLCDKVFHWQRNMDMKIILWIIAIIFIVGLLTLTGVFKLIF